MQRYMHVLRGPRIGCDYQALLCFAIRRPHVVFQDDINVHRLLQSVVYSRVSRDRAIFIMFVQPLKLPSVYILFRFCV